MRTEGFFAQWRSSRLNALQNQGQKIPRQALESIQKGTLAFTYKGQGCWKSPFDMALYTLLLQNLRPQTIVELGSGQGGSALWFADMADSLELGTTVYSFDLNPVTELVDSRIAFEEADIYDLADSRLGEVLQSARHPILIVEDGPHTYEACLKALQFCDRYLHRGDYIVIEDGIVQQLGMEAYQDGPQRAIASFVEDRPDKYKIDRFYCDYYGPNVTWNPNGYLKRIGPEA